jgi:hypothetical protein
METIRARSALAREPVAMKLTPPPTHYPALAEELGNALGAAARVARAAVSGAPLLVDRGEMERRRSICLACPHYDPRPQRCKLCGCFAAWKASIATERCPDEPPRW